MNGLDEIELAYSREIAVAVAKGDNDRAREMQAALLEYQLHFKVGRKGYGPRRD